jgi:chromosome segregation ATPase
VATQLYRYYKLSSSKRSAPYDTAYHNNVIGLSRKVETLQQQVDTLVDNQKDMNDRYSCAKRENAALKAQVEMLVCHLCEYEERAEERLQEEQLKIRALLVRTEREKQLEQLEIENSATRLQTLELEGRSLREESTRIRSQVELLRAETATLEELRREGHLMMEALREELQTLRKVERRAKEEKLVNAQIVEELHLELDRLKAELEGGEIMKAYIQSELKGQLHDDLSERFHELQIEMINLRHQNKILQETTEELQAQMLTWSLEGGRDLMTGVGNGNSLANELEAISAQDAISCPSHDGSNNSLKGKCLIVMSYGLMIAMCGIFSAPIYPFARKLFFIIK